MKHLCCNLSLSLCYSLSAIATRWGMGWHLRCEVLCRLSTARFFLF
jgi:hypothetical protein